MYFGLYFISRAVVVVVVVLGVVPHVIACFAGRAFRWPTWVNARPWRSPSNARLPAPTRISRSVAPMETPTGQCNAVFFKCGEKLRPNFQTVKTLREFRVNFGARLEIRGYQIPRNSSLVSPLARRV